MFWDWSCAQLSHVYWDFITGMIFVWIQWTNKFDNSISVLLLITFIFLPVFGQLCVTLRYDIYEKNRSNILILLKFVKIRENQSTQVKLSYSANLPRAKIDYFDEYWECSFKIIMKVVWSCEQGCHLLVFMNMSNWQFSR